MCSCICIHIHTHSQSYIRPAPQMLYTPTTLHPCNNFIETFGELFTSPFDIFVFFFSAPHAV